MAVNKLILSKNKPVVVCIDEDFEAYFDKHSWCITRQGYLLNDSEGFFHRKVLGSYSDEFGDHINNIRSDNRFCNLRNSTFAQNAYNQSKTKKPRLSQYKGATYDKNRGKWKAGIGYQSRYINLGRFDTEKEAALSYNEAALRLFGEFAKINLISDSE